MEKKCNSKICFSSSLSSQSNADDRPEPLVLYQYGPKDIATVFFYLLIAVILHALIQEYVLDVSEQSFYTEAEQKRLE